VKPKGLKIELDRIAGAMESLEYEFYDSKNEDAALEMVVLALDCLTELGSIVERDDAFKRFKKND
jgi:hypothetical protein